MTNRRQRDFGCPKQLIHSSAESGFCLLSYLPILFLAPLPLALYVPVPWASLGFLTYPKADFDSGLLHLLPLPGVFFLLQGLVYTSSARPSLPT